MLHIHEFGTSAVGCGQPERCTVCMPRVGPGLAISCAMVPASPPAAAACRGSGTPPCRDFNIFRPSPDLLLKNFKNAQEEKNPFSTLHTLKSNPPPAKTTKNLRRLQVQKYHPKSPPPTAPYYPLSDQRWIFGFDF